MKYVRTDDGVYGFKEENMSINKGIYTQLPTYNTLEIWVLRK